MSNPYSLEMIFSKIILPSIEVHNFFISNTFIGNSRLKLVKNFPLSSSTLSSKNNRIIFKNVQKTTTSVQMRLYD